MTRRTTQAMLDAARNRPKRSNPNAVAAMLAARKAKDAARLAAKMRPMRVDPAIHAYREAKAQRAAKALPESILVTLRAELARQTEASRGYGPRRGVVIAVKRGRPPKPKPVRDDPANALVGALGPWRGE